jgi:ubiquinol-cytochrome c reductase cytochrome b subunit
VSLSQIAAAYYFAHFLIILPLIARFERTLPLPNSITESVLQGKKQKAAPAGTARRKSVAGG